MRSGGRASRPERAFALAAALLSTLLACAPSGPHHSRTSVLLLTWCTTRADHLGLYGHAQDTSPHLDALVARGAVFLRVLTAAPWTRPSIAALVTSRYPRVLGVDDASGWKETGTLPDTLETLAERLHASGYTTIGVTSNPNTSAGLGFAQGYDAYVGPGQLSAGPKLKAPAEVVNAAFLEVLDDRGTPSPFFAHLVYIDPHLPYLRENAAEDAPGFTPSGATEGYDRQIRYLDSQQHALLEAVGDRGYDDLLVVVTSDHGEGFNARRKDRRHGSQLYDSTLWVALAFHHPKLESRAARFEPRVETVDLVPTLLDLLAIPYLPADVSGHSLAGAIRGESSLEGRTFSVVETRFRLQEKSAALTDRWKLIADYAHATGARPGFELFDRVGDPRELENRADAEPAVVDELYGRLEAWRRAHDAGTSPEAQLTPEELEHLRTLGYLDGDEG